jgi:rhomboid protease GluP
MNTLGPPTSRPAPVRQGVRLSLARPAVTCIVLAIIAAFFVLETLPGGSTNLSTLEGLGMQMNSRVASGDYWRLLASMGLLIS